MDELSLKLTLIAVMLALSIIFGLLPLKVLQLLRKRAASAANPFEGTKWPSLVLCLLTCFSGGVFLATCFLHLFPEVIEKMDNIVQKYHWPGDYPVAELISCGGFFLVFLLEELVILLLRGGGHGHHNHRNHSEDEAPPTHHHHQTNGSVVHVHVVQASRYAQDDADDMKLKKLKTDLKNSFFNAHSGCCADDVPDERRAELEALKPPTNADCFHSHIPAAARENGLSPYANPNFNKISCAETCTGIELPISAEPECCEGPCEGRKEDPPIMMAYRPHAHSHGVRSVTLVVALSFHSLLEGLAFGIQDTKTSTTVIFLGIIIHKCVLIFSTGVQLARTHAHQLLLVIITILLLSIMSPLGAGVGVAVVQSWTHSVARDVTIMVFSGLSVGTFLYVTFFEVLIHERDNEHNNLLKLLATLIGFVLMAGLRAMEPKHSHGEHGHDHGHGHVMNVTFSSASTTLPTTLS